MGEATLNREAAGGALHTFCASDGYTFYYRHYPSPVPPKARLVFVHGIRSHGGWYQRSCRRLAEAGFDVYFLDRRGGGLNTAHRGDTHVVVAVEGDKSILDVTCPFGQRSPSS